MATISKSILKTEAYFSDDYKHRYLLRKEWEKSSKKAMIIMIQPSMADTMLLDATTVFVINNMHKLEFGSIEIVNLFSKVDTKLRLKDGLPELIGGETDSFIKKCGEKVDAIIIAWGTIGNSNKKIKERQQEVLELLVEHQDKMYIICDPKGKKGLHPLCPSVRSSWILEPHQLESQSKPEQQQKQKKKQNQTKSKPKGKEQEKTVKGAKQGD